MFKKTEKTLLFIRKDDNISADIEVSISKQEKEELLCREIASRHHSINHQTV